jgi:hypothetical protein
VRTRTALAAITAITAVAAVAGLGVYAVWHSVPHSLPLHVPVSEACMVTDDAPPPDQDPSAGSLPPQQVLLDPEQMANAATISAVGIRRGVPERAVVVALATALQESKLRNLPEGDRDSVGLFQQRPSQGWGKPEQLADPRYAAGAFYTSLLKIKGWQQLRVTDAAQRVQRSAAPEAYQRWAADSAVLAHAFAGNASGAVACTVVSEPPERGAAAVTDLANGVRLDWGNVRSVASTDVVGLSLSVNDTRAGWRYAHWLVAHSVERGVKRVRFADLEWTAKGGSWSKISSAAPTGGQQVVAEVYAS